MSQLCNMLQKWLYLISGLSDFISVRETYISRAWAPLALGQFLCYEVYIKYLCSSGIYEHNL